MEAVTVKMYEKTEEGYRRIKVCASSFENWFPDTFYEAGDFVYCGDLVYRANTKHTSAANFKDDMKPGTEKWRVIGSGEDVGGIKQLTKLSVIAPVTLEIPISKTLTFARPPVEVLKLTPGSKDVVTTLCAFDNGDADDFTVGGESGETARFVEFDGAMRPRTVYDVAMSAPVAMGECYYSESEEIDFADYKTVEAVE